MAQLKCEAVEIEGWQAVRNYDREVLTNSGVRAVRSFLFKIGLYSNLMGFDYLVCAVGEVFKNPNCLHSITKQLYPSIARKFETTPTGVERNIRNAIETAYNKGYKFTICRFFIFRNLLGIRVVLPA